MEKQCYIEHSYLFCKSEAKLWTTLGFGLGLGTTSTAVLRQGFISANTAVSVTQASEFQSGHKVVKMVVNN